MESNAQADLAINYHNDGNYEKALEYHKANLSSCRRVNDKQGEIIAYGHIGNILVAAIFNRFSLNVNTEFFP